MKETALGQYFEVKDIQNKPVVAKDKDMEDGPKSFRDGIDIDESEDSGNEDQFEPLPKDNANIRANKPANKRVSIMDKIRQNTKSFEEPYIKPLNLNNIDSSNKIHESKLIFLKPIEVEKNTIHTQPLSPKNERNKNKKRSKSPENSSRVNTPYQLMPTKSPEPKYKSEKKTSQVKNTQSL